MTLSAADTAAAAAVLGDQDSRVYAELADSGIEYSVRSATSGPDGRYTVVRLAGGAVAGVERPEAGNLADPDGAVLIGQVRDFIGKKVS
jgi:hypothetical protein